jgi:hypothetical protein
MKHRRKIVTEGERILTVFNGGTPDQVPYMLDLSHFFYQKFKKPIEMIRDAGTRRGINSSSPAAWRQYSGFLRHPSRSLRRLS